MNKVNSILSSTDGEEAENILRWNNGDKILTETSVEDFIIVIKTSCLVVRMTKPTGKMIEVTVNNGELIQINISSDEEDTTNAYEIWKPEFRSFLFSGKYAIELIPYKESYCQEADDIKPSALCGDKT